MKHAGQAALDQLEPLLTKIREFAGLKEKSRGVFYYKSKPFLHFHEDPAGLFADLMYGDIGGRVAVNTEKELKELLKRIAAAIMTEE
jgi:hypothetical protein